MTGAHARRDALASHPPIGTIDRRPRMLTTPRPQAYELSVLTGTQVLLLVVSETGLVYTFTTPKLQPLVTKPEGKTLIQVSTAPRTLRRPRCARPRC